MFLMRSLGTTCWLSDSPTQRVRAHLISLEYGEDLPVHLADANKFKEEFEKCQAEMVKVVGDKKE